MQVTITSEIEQRLCACCRTVLLQNFITGQSDNDNDDHADDSSDDNFMARDDDNLEVLESPTVTQPGSQAARLGGVGRRVRGPDKRPRKRKVEVCHTGNKGIQSLDRLNALKIFILLI